MAVELKTKPHSLVIDTPLVLEVSPQEISETSNNLYLNSNEAMLLLAYAKADEAHAVDEIIYGWREVYETNENGETIRTLVDLTLEDYLHPQEGDMYMHGNKHDNICYDLKSTLMTYVVPYHHNSVAYHDVGIKWSRTSNHLSPDISMIYDVRDPERPRGMFHVADEGTAPSLVIEVTSWSTRHTDIITKVRNYAHLGVPYYIIVDRGTRRRETLRLTGYELTPNGYVELVPNNQGWLWMAPVGLWIGIHENRVQCYDAQGNYLLNQVELTEGLAETSEQLAATSEQLAETSVALAEETTARAEAEEARAEAEQQAEQEAAARAKAEQQAEQEAAARAEAEQQAEQEAAARAEAEQARVEAEQKVATEAKMRAELEEQIRLLQAQLHQKN
ncbi:MAG: Uma2 family endonuclease [Chloroflexota bacterium]